MGAITVSNLTKTFKVHQKEPGFSGSLRSLVNRKYDKVHAVSGISFNIEPGELVGFIGPNGAGKTTTLKVLSGLLYPTSGEISVLGFTPWERKSQFQKQFSLVMGQKNQLWWDLPAEDSFLLNKEIYEIPDDRYHKSLNNLVDLLEVRDLLKVQVRKLSLGQRMKMELIAALLHSPQILFLDEPTIGLDVVMQKKMRDFIKNYNQYYNSTIILTSHYMEDVKDLCRRVIIIDKGLIIFDGLLEDIVKRYAHNKLITITFNKEVDRKTLGKLGSIQFFDYPKAVVSVKRSSTASIVTRLLNQFPVDDLNIEEPAIEEVIRSIFNKN